MADSGERMPSWVLNVLVTSWSAAWQPEHDLVRGRCDAPAAEAFRAAFPGRCQRRSGHEGDHSIIPDCPSCR